MENQGLLTQAASHTATTQTGHPHHNPLEIIMKPDLTPLLQLATYFQNTAYIIGLFACYAVASLLDITPWE